MDRTESLLLSHRLLAFKIANEFARLIRSKEYDECQQIAMIACWRAAKKWDGRNAFSIWASIIIKAALREWHENDGLIRIPRTMVQAANRIRKGSTLETELKRRNAFSRNYSENVWRNGILTALTMKRELYEVGEAD